MKRLLITLVLLQLACGIATIPQSDNKDAGINIKPSILSTPTAFVSTGIICQSGGLNVRTGAGTEYAQIDVILDGEIVLITDNLYSEAGYLWYKIEYADGAGWARARYVC